MKLTYLVSKYQLIFMAYTSIDLIESFKSNDMSLIKHHFENSTKLRIDHNVSFRAAKTGNMEIFDLIIEFNWSFCQTTFFEIGKLGQIEHIRSIYERLKHK